MPAATLEEATSKPPDGVVLPPKELRHVIEKTAGYVARNGASFEQRMRVKDANNPKFSFLNSNDAYYPYYAWRLNEVREGRGTDVSAGRVGEAQAQASEKPKGPPEPPGFFFSVRMPNINSKDLDIVHMTARFVALNGKDFVTRLGQREAGNYQFDFLRPQHSLHQYFSRLVDQYSDLANGGSVNGASVEKERIAQLERNVKDRAQILARATERADWVQFQEKQKQKHEEATEKDKLEYAQIDWHDFVAIQEIHFNDADRETELGPLTSLNDLLSASLEQKAMMSLQPPNMRIEEAMPTDEDPYFNATPATNYTPAPNYALAPNYAPVDYHIAPTPPQPVFSPQSAYSPHPPPQPVQAYASPPHQMGFQVPAQAQDEEENARIRERAEARDRAEAARTATKGMGRTNIRTDYVPQAAKKRNVASSMCPHCKQMIPNDELEQHMKIELLDPEWKKQRDKAQARYASTNLSTTDVANNLKRLASQRSDVFDPVTGQQVLSAEEEARKKKQKEAIPYDGQPDTKAQLQGLNITEQIRHIHQKYKS